MSKRRREPKSRKDPAAWMAKAVALMVAPVRKRKGKNQPGDGPHSHL